MRQRVIDSQNCIIGTKHDTHKKRSESIAWCVRLSFFLHVSFALLCAKAFLHPWCVTLGCKRSSTVDIHAIFFFSQLLFSLTKIKQQQIKKKALKTAMNIEWGRLPIAMVVSLFLLPVVAFIQCKRSFEAFLFLTRSRMSAVANWFPFDFFRDSIFLFGKISLLSEPQIELQPKPPRSKAEKISLNKSPILVAVRALWYLIFIISFLRVYKSDGPARVYVQKPLRRCSVAIRKHFFHQTSLHFFFLNNRIFFLFAL